MLIERRFDIDDGRRTHTEFLHPKSCQQGAYTRISCEFTTEGDGFVVGFGGTHDLVYETPYRRLEYAKHAHDAAIGTVGSHRILEKIVGTYAEEIDFTGKYIGHYGSGGRFDHDAYLRTR